MIALQIIRAPLVFFPLVVARCIHPLFIRFLHILNYNVLPLLSCADAAVALGRISSFLTAEELAEPYTIDTESKLAIDVDGDFQWETAYKSDIGGKKFDTGKGKDHGKGKGSEAASKAQSKDKDGKSAGKGGLFRKKKTDPVLPVTASAGDAKKADEKEKSEDKPFELRHLALKIPKGSFVAIVGRVGSGKVSATQSFLHACTQC